ncbi:unannotated protein [freshwater metagenome]|uniref:Unannotated protein n=1 Tax=freshwater metagenome TaxID=449393 RepID=A0A6J7KJW3_9ZZZZ
MATVATTSFVDVSNTITPSELLARYRREPSGLTATRLGTDSTSTVATTSFVDVSITLTEELS